jgi:hypothetical protein
MTLFLFNDLILDSCTLSPQLATFAVITYLVVLILSNFIYTLLKNISITAFNKLSYNFKLNLLRLAPMNAVSKVLAEKTTVVNLADSDLNQLIGVFLQEIGNTNQITMAQLQSFGLKTPSVIEYLTSLGYIIS